MNCAGVAPSIANINTWTLETEVGRSGLNCFSPPVSTVCVTSPQDDCSSIKTEITASNPSEFLTDIERNPSVIECGL